MKDLPQFKSKELFDQAFTHRSYLNEARQQKLSSNERLEFLGDSILSFVVSRFLYEKYPEYNEGMLTNLRALMVNTKSLAEVARELEFGKYLKLSKGEDESKGRENQSLLADSFEAYLGALFLDQGLEAAKDFLARSLLPKAEELVMQKSLKDPKSLLQEFSQAQKKSSPLYKVLAEEGPAHERTFTVGVYIQDTLMGEGSGKSKQAAEEQAAEIALEKMQK